MPKHAKKWTLENRRLTHGHLERPEWTPIGDIAKDLGVTHALVSNMTSKGLRRVAEITLKKMGTSNPTPVQIDELAFNEAFIDIIIELLRQKPLYSRAAKIKAKSEAHESAK